jgi:hypothetical protein
MKVEVFEPALVVCSSSCNKVYGRGVHLAPRAHIEQIESQGKGRRLREPGIGRLTPRAPKSVDVEIKRDGSIVEAIGAPQ